MAAPGRLPGGPASIDRLAADLDLVIKAGHPPEGMPVVLVGHSMGGMTIMALAGRNPALFGTKIIGVVLISTAAGRLDAGSPWMPGPLRLVTLRSGTITSASATAGTTRSTSLTVTNNPTARAPRSSR